MFISTAGFKRSVRLTSSGIFVLILDGEIYDRDLEFDLDLEFDFDLVLFLDLVDLVRHFDSRRHFEFIEIELFLVLRFSSQT